MQVLGNAFIILGRIQPEENNTTYFLAQRGYVVLDFIKDVTDATREIPMFEMNPEPAI